MSEQVRNKFFKRPFYSKFLHPENLGKTFMASTFPLPQCLSRYEKVSLNIFYHESISTFSKDVKAVMYQKEVGLFYVVDTLIKDSMIYLRKVILENEKINEDIENHNNKNYLQKFDELIIDPKNKFILKLCLLEDYLFGDIPISNNENIRRKIREREKVNLLLMTFEESKIKPNISNFPFIIQVVERQEYSYETLLNFFMNKIDIKNENFNDKSIVFMMKSEIQNSEVKNEYTKKFEKRREYLKKYIESGECDYPFIVMIKSINNLTSIIEHICSENYEFSNMILLNFKKKQRMKKNIIQNIAKKFLICLKTKKGEKEDDKEKTLQHEAKMNKTRENDYLNEKSLLNDLNFMEFTKNNNEEIININNKNKIQNINTKSLKEYYNCFYDKNPENVDYSKELKINFYDCKKEKYYSPFTKIKQFINFIPAHIILEVSLVYGLNKIRVFSSKGCIIKEDIIINEKINFSQFKKNEHKKVTSSTTASNPDYDILYFSNIPRESRISCEILCFDPKFQKNFVLGSGSTQIYDEHGILKSGIQEVYVWPFFENDVKIINNAPFHRKKSSDLNEDFNKNNYGIIYLEFPKFNSEVIHTYKTPESYNDFLMLKNYPNSSGKKYNINQFSKFYNDSISNTDNIVKNIFNSFYNINETENELNIITNNEKDETTFFLDKNELESLLKIMTIEPLRKIEDKERQLIIKSRDYISTIPSKLELFLRCINWFDPIQAYIAKTYLNKWEKIELIDAIGLLDARFPNIYVREYALSIINESTDDLKDLYMLQIIYALMYEPYNESYLTDFIIENSLKRPYFASKFITMSKILKDHPYYTEKICIIITQILMLSGTKYIYELEKTINSMKLFSNISKRSKSVKEQKKLSTELLNKEIKEELNELFLNNEKISLLIKDLKDSKNYNNNLDSNDAKLSNKEEIPTIDIENIKNEKLNTNIPEYKDFNKGALIDVTVPVFPSFYISDSLFDRLKTYDSKMIPIEYYFYPSEGNNKNFIGKSNNSLYNLKSLINVFYKNGDDLRQDHLALQALRTMDRLWLENDLDLKVFGYSVLPIGQKDGFMEKCEALPYNKVQTGKSISGIFDRELIKKYFDKKAQEIIDSLPQNPNDNKQALLDEIKFKQVDNFVRSLAGYCVATCVLGIADRHSDNIMIQDNGIFLHIDYGHILGNFKEKLGFKREKSKFVLDQTMVNFCKQYNMEEEFKYFCVKAYNILRKNANRLMNLFIIMSSSGMPELYSLNNIKYFRDMLKLEKKNDEDAGNYFLCLINQSKNDKYRYFDNIFHNINHLKISKKPDGDKGKKKFYETLFGCFFKKKNIENKNNNTKQTK